MSYIIDDAKDITYDGFIKVNRIIYEVFYIMIASHQIRAARAILRWSAKDLAEKARISLPTVQRIEAAEGVPSTTAATLDAIERALKEAGVSFVPENGEGAGVRLARRSDGTVSDHD